MNSTAPPVIHARNLFKSYRSFQAVKDLSFSVPEGSCYGFLGPNGAGKTTTMKVLYGKALRDRHPETEVSVYGYDPAGEELEIKNLSGVVPQDNALDEDLSVRQNLLIFSRFYGMTGPAARRRIDELLEFMELEKKQKEPIKELSGGMQRRLAIARALLNRPRLLILDEPTTGLDPQVRHLIWNKLRDLQKQRVTILLTTHYMDEAYQICDTILIMDRGRKILEGPPRQLLAEHLEPYVLEQVVRPGEDEAPAKDQGASTIAAGTAAGTDTGTSAGPPLPAGIRRENQGGVQYYFSSSMADLEEWAQQREMKVYNLRQANLEDLFLKTTGRTLNELQ